MPDILSEYVDAGYVEDGYVETTKPVIFKAADTRCQLRGPSAKSGTVTLFQADEYATGWQRTGFDPRAVVHLMTLGYNRLSDIERADLEVFHAAVDATVDLFTYRDDLAGLDFPVRFDSPDLDITEESYNRNSASIALWSAASFFPLAGGQPAPTIDDADTVLNRFFYSGGRRIARKQPRGYDSTGDLYIYNKSPIKRQTYRLVMYRRTFAELAALISFFVSAAVGIKNTFQMTFDETLHTMRFASNVLSWERSTIRSSLYDVSVEVEEDLAR